MSVSKQAALRLIVHVAFRWQGSDSGDNIFSGNLIHLVLELLPYQPWDTQGSALLHIRSLSMLAIISIYTLSTFYTLEK